MRIKELRKNLDHCMGCQESQLIDQEQIYEGYQVYRKSRNSRLLRISIISKISRIYIIKRKSGISRILKNLL